MRRADERRRIVARALRARPLLDLIDVDAAEVVAADAEHRKLAPCNVGLLPNRKALVQQRRRARLRVLLLAPHVCVEPRDNDGESRGDDDDPQDEARRMAQPQHAERKRADHRNGCGRAACGREEGDQQKGDFGERRGAKPRAHRRPIRGDRRQQRTEADDDVDDALIDMPDRIELDAFVGVRPRERDERPDRRNRHADLKRDVQLQPLALAVTAALDEPQDRRHAKHIAPAAPLGGMDACENGADRRSHEPRREQRIPAVPAAAQGLP